MKVLFIGGTGIISTASTELAAERGIELTLLRRGQRVADLPKNVRTITADVADEAAVSEALGKQSFDAVVDWRRLHARRHRAGHPFVPGPHEAVCLHQFGERLSKAGRPLSDYGIDAAGQSLLAIFARQDRLRRAA